MFTSRGEGRHRHGFHQGKGVFFQENSILECPRLRFVGVADQVMRFFLGVGHRLPLAGRGKGSASATEKPRGIHLAKHPLGPEVQGVGQSPVPAVLAVIGQAAGVYATHPPEQPQGFLIELRNLPVGARGG